ncbi:MAG TPA: acyltransferase [Candidatus Elarobacter sp.]|nr:acyltransferase [Candidatus Elarobacter sp.]
MSAAPATATARTYYPHVEGLRGVAALYVFVFHIWQTAIQHPATATLGAWFAATPFLQYGHFSVAAFIVVSGFCLGLPVAQREGKPLNAKRFFLRRARRLMPAYVPVVLLSAIPFAASAILLGGHANVPHIAIAIALHLALIHNLFYATTEYLNGPLWSIALECQIYVVFALLLVPLWRRFGLVAPFVAAVIVGFAPHQFGWYLDWSVPWLVVLFAMGMIAADLCARRELPKVPWNVLALVSAAVTVAALTQYRDGARSDIFAAGYDLLLGLSIALFFVAAHLSERILPARFLAARPIVFLGTFSYSLYLIHAPIVDLVGAVLYRIHAGPALSAAVWAAVIAAVLVAAYGFYLVFERPFLSAGFRRAIDADVHREGAPVPLTLAAESAA